MDDTQAPSLRTRISPRLVVGLAVMAVGLLLTLDNLGIVETQGLWRYWPVVLVLIGLSKFVQGADLFGALIWVVVGVGLVAANLGLFHLNWRHLWPVVLVIVGARLVFGTRGGRGVTPRATTGSGPRPLSHHAVYDGDATIDAFAVLGGVQRGTNSTAFRSAAASAFMGGCEIDLRQAKMAGPEAVFDAFAMWGGVEIKVPEDWAVENRGFAFLGGFVDSTRRPAEPKGRLVLTGLAIMGGVEVKN